MTAEDILMKLYGITEDKRQAFKNILSFTHKADVEDALIQLGKLPSSPGLERELQDWMLTFFPVTCDRGIKR